ncbi:MAG: universal stress protein [Bacteroidales bacterium]
MKKIVVGIDFSKNSIHALEYSIMIANKAKADVTMIWVNNTATSEYVFSTMDSELKQEKRQNFDKLIRDYQPGLKGGKLGYKLSKGKVHLEMMKLAGSLDADLMITGTHGVSGYEEYWIGSNAYRIVTHAPCPVITLRYDFAFRKGIDKIIFPIDSSQETKQKLPICIELSRLFGSEIHVLAMYTTALRSFHQRVDNFVDQVTGILDGEKVPCKVYRKETDNITRTTIDYARQNDVDMIAIMTEQENTTANIFLGPYAQQLINHSPVPVLSIRSGMLKR